MRIAFAAPVLAATLALGGAVSAASPAAVTPETLSALEGELVTRHGEEALARAKRGLAQAAALWRSSDGDAAAFAEVARTHFLADRAQRDALFERIQKVLESVDGHFLEVARDLREHSDLDRGEILAFDEAMAGWDPSAHVLDDLFGNRLAFAVLLNFPLTTLQERLEKGPSWSRREWAEARLAERFGKRIPADVSQAVASASADASRYVAEYNLGSTTSSTRRGVGSFRRARGSSRTGTSGTRSRRATETRRTVSRSSGRLRRRWSGSSPRRSRRSPSTRRGSTGTPSRTG